MEKSSSAISGEQMNRFKYSARLSYLTDNLFVQRSEWMDFLIYRLEVSEGQ